MKITVKYEHLREFSKLKFGAAFIIYGTERKYIKLYEELLTKEMHYKRNAVRLDDGTCLFIEANERVVPLDGEFFYTEEKQREWIK